MRALYACPLALLLTSVALAQPPDSLWSRTYGGDGDEWCHSVQQTVDGEYILAGWTSSFGAGSEDFWLVKTDANGDSLWSRTYGGNDLERCYSVQQTRDGGYILAGLTESFGGGGDDFWLVKTDGNGDSLWSRTFGASNNDACFSVQQTADGGYILGGCTVTLGGDGYSALVKTDSSGNSQWSRIYGGSGWNSVQQTADGGYVLGGSVVSFGQLYEDFALVKTDSSGGSLWSRTFGGSYNEI
ncbi:MAG: hypothetical protein NT025_01675, partial [bacterium]|nr:hypothetical protein [bacterium]